MIAWSLVPAISALPAERLEGGLAVLELLGCVLGKALYEGILVEMPLAPFFVSRLQVCVPRACVSSLV